MRILSILLLITGCSTTSLMKCDNKIGIEKEDCIKRIMWKQEQLRPVRDRMMDYGGRRD